MRLPGVYGESAVPGDVDEPLRSQGGQGTMDTPAIFESVGKMVRGSGEDIGREFIRTGTVDDYLRQPVPISVICPADNAGTCRQIGHPIWIRQPRGYRAGRLSGRWTGHQGTAKARSVKNRHRSRPEPPQSDVDAADIRHHLGKPQMLRASDGDGRAFTAGDVESQ